MEVNLKNVEVILKKTKITKSILNQSNSLSFKEIDKNNIIGWCFDGKSKIVVSYNNEFLYPKGGAGSFIDILYNNLDKNRILLNTCITSIDYDNKIVTTSTNAQYKFEYLINTAPLNHFLKLFNNPDFNKLEKVAERKCIKYKYLSWEEREEHRKEMEKTGHSVIGTDFGWDKNGERHFFIEYIEGDLPELD